MHFDERATLEAILAVSETNEYQVKSLFVHTESSADDFINHLVNVDIPTWEKSREIENKRLHHFGVVCGWAASGLIDAEKYAEYQTRIESAICERIRAILA
ncbi:hypothetical protein VNTUMSATTG_61400 (plasmid) [Vibrio nigripulchritudo]|uniref:hypothetical protein n=1 Tax=Vibrio nigripulchritudo TaxID=28173 RepID=UPI00190B2BF9|nr:hypothetical protein [Vibrio nigripulchritudo]BCL74203.1 hypothetical protein VNTUMSATTG_61400 [Vibrio nigripulchritudo]